MKMHLWITQTEYDNDNFCEIWTNKPILVRADEYQPTHFEHPNGFSVELCKKHLRRLLRSTGKRLPRTHTSMVEIDVWAK
jgi:hypothetical protein